MPASVLIRHPNTYFLQVQSPSPTIRFLMLTESLVSSGKDIKRHFSARAVPSKNSRCWSAPPCTAVITSSMYQLMCVRLSMVWGGPGPVSGISKMAPYAGTGSNVCTNEFAKCVSVSDIAQKYSGESTHPIGSTRLMQIITQSSLAAAGTT